MAATPGSQGSDPCCPEQGDPVLIMSHRRFPQQTLQVCILMCCRYPAWGLEGVLLDKTASHVTPATLATAWTSYPPPVFQQWSQAAQCGHVLKTLRSPFILCTTKATVIQVTAQFLQKPVPGFEKCEDEETSDPDTN